MTFGGGVQVNLEGLNLRTGTTRLYGEPGPMEFGFDSGARPVAAGGYVFVTGIHDLTNDFSIQAYAQRRPHSSRR